MRRTGKRRKVWLTMALCFSMMLGNVMIVNAESNPYPTQQNVDKDDYYEVPCTWFAWQQAYEKMGIELPAWGNGGEWYDAAEAAGFSVGSVPQENSIAVWTGDTYGHVAYVVGVTDDTTFTVNEGGRTDLDDTDSHGVAYGYTLTNAVGEVRPYDSGKTLVGFIYLGETAREGTLDIGGEFVVEGGKVVSDWPEGVSFDFETNTLTLTNFETSSMIIAYNFGDDFTVHLEGENAITGTAYMQIDSEELTIEGPGSLSFLSESWNQYSIIYNKNLTIKSCTINIDNQGESAIFCGIEKNIDYGYDGSSDSLINGMLQIENANINIHSEMPESASEYTYNMGINVQNGNLNIIDSQVDVEVENGTVYGIAVGNTLASIDDDNGRILIQNSTVKCISKSSIADGKYNPCNMYFYEMENQDNYYYIGEVDPEEEKPFEDVFWKDYRQYRNSDGCLVITDTQITGLCKHQWDEGVVTTEPGCGTRGEKKYTCTLCGKMKIEKLAAIGNHDYEWVVEKEATSDEEGIKKGTCKVCGNEVTETIPKKEKEASFSDVSESDWFYDKVQYVYANNLMSGMDDTHFAPNENLTRAQFATILYRISGTPEVTYSAKFSDVPDGQWYTKGILWASSAGVVSGYSDGRYGTDDNITREQMAVMMYRYAQSQSYDTTASAELDVYADASQISDYAKEALKWAVGNGIMSGKTSTTLDPHGKATRAECATIIMRFVEKYQ